MKTVIKLSASVVALSVLLTGLVFAYTFNSGALTSDATYEERVAFPSTTGNFTFHRTQVLVPQDYGRLVAITPSAGTAVLWFESKDGRVRNLPVNANAPVIIDRKGTLN